MEQYQLLLAIMNPSSVASKNSVELTPGFSEPDLSSDSPMVNMAGIDLKPSAHFSATAHWIVDTSATNHMVHSISVLTSITSTLSSFVKLPTGKTVPVTHVGIVHISPHLLLANVLVVPSFAFSLLSVSLLTKQIPGCLILLHNHLFIQDLRTWKTIGMAEEHGGLYYLVSSSGGLQISSISNKTSFPYTASVHNDAATLWHCRLGHPSLSRLSLLHNSVPAISLSKPHHCTICPSAKQHKLPFPLSVKKTQFPFELIHCDVWGPFAVQSHNGARFFLTIVDDFTRSTWVHLLNSKSETHSHIVSFFTLVETQFNTKIKTLRTDFGTEFNLHSFLSSKGVVHRHSCVATPQQNGTVVRKHQHLLNVARPLGFNPMFLSNFRMSAYSLPLALSTDYLLLF